jgi:uncharacterized protein
VTGRLPVLLVGLIALLSAAADAQSPGAESPAAARELGRILTGDSLELVLNQAMNAMVPFTRSLAQRDLKRPLTQAEETALITAFRRSFEQTYPRTLWEEETAQILSRTFTEPELGELLQFYRSPVGKRLLALNSSLMPASERLFKSREEQFGQSLMGELARELRRPAP